MNNEPQDFLYMAAASVLGGMVFAILVQVLVWILAR